MACKECGAVGGIEMDISVRKHKKHGIVCTVCFPPAMFGYYREPEDENGEVGA